MEKMTALSFLFLMAALPTHASPPERWAAAQAAYDAGDFAAARDGYESLAREGWSGVALCHNLGNAYYRLGEKGRARLWYDRALSAAPRDEDVRHNRGLVLAKMGLKEEDDGPARWAGPASWLLFGVNALFFGLLSWRFIGRTGESWWWSCWAAGLALAAAALLAWAARADEARPRAVVVAPQAEARSAPSEEASLGFVVPEGAEVAVFRRAGDWMEVGLPSQGVKGWIPAGDAAPIDATAEEEPPRKKGML